MSKGFQFGGNRNECCNYFHEPLTEAIGDAVLLFDDFQSSNPEVNGVKICNHIIAGRLVAPFYVIYKAGKFYGQGTLSKLK